MSLEYEEANGREAGKERKLVYEEAGKGRKLVEGRFCVGSWRA